MSCNARLPFGKAGAPSGRALCVLLMLAATLGLSACGSEKKEAARVLAKVNGEEITSADVSDEMTRAGVKAGKKDPRSAHFLESLIDRRLLAEEAVRMKAQRVPEVEQAIERARAEILAQAYLGRIEAGVPKPSAAEIGNYYRQHPEFFAQRRQYAILKLVIARQDFGDELKAEADAAKSLDEVAAWLDRHQIAYTRGRLSLRTTDLPALMVAKLKDARKNQMFRFDEGENTLLLSIASVRDDPIELADAAPQIEQYLINARTMEAVGAEVARLRSLARIDYLGASGADTVQATGAPAPARPADPIRMTRR